MKQFKEILGWGDGTRRKRGNISLKNNSRRTIGTLQLWIHNNDMDASTSSWCSNRYIGGLINLHASVVKLTTLTHSF